MTAPAKAAPMREDVTHLVVHADREAAWPFRGGCYGAEDKAGWMRGKYDHNLAISSFARHRLAHTARPDAGDEDVERVARAINEVDDPDHQYAVVSSNYSRPFLAGAYPTLDAALLAQNGKPDRWHIYRRLAAMREGVDRGT